ncbi:VanZ family protein [Paenibacillus sp. GSMTC-2017]|uniref:VanZ family protein n=1 Tax=Paenibacillus sp. GSMTC-2017 TaxID=2794350 RepID=UPI0018D76834|nr:VanZ family protein [Paenibacillus sp. GSMTC-2017]MBH5319653.1 VanZ family protein [Paenibacillus sp. GSMTC-2017]
MMTYVFPIKIAVFVFLAASFMLVVPWLFYSYRKYGFFSVWHSIVSFSFIFYMLSALFLVLLPLPTTRDTCSFQSADTIYYSLVPFTFVSDILRKSTVVWSQPGTYVSIFKQIAFWQVAFNFLLLLPLGVYIRYFFRDKRYWKHALGVGFGLSLFYEVTQVTGIYGLYNCPYRLFDVDDLIINSAGALVGFAVAPILLALFPSNENIKAKRTHMIQKDIVSPIAQLLAIWIDIIIVNVSYALIFGLFTTNKIYEYVFYSLCYFIVFFVIPLIRDGKTIGTGFMRYRLVSSGSNKPFWKQMWMRFIALYLTWLTLSLLGEFNQVDIPMSSSFYIAHVWVNLAMVLLRVVIWITLLVHVSLVIFKKDRRLFYFDSVADLNPTRKSDQSIAKDDNQS